MSELPKGWAICTLEECCAVISGQSPPGETYNEEGIGLPFYQGKAEFNDLFPTPRKWCTEPTKTAIAGDVLISVRAPVGPTNLASETCCIGRGLAALRPLNGVETRFVLYQIRATEQRLASVATGSTFSAVSSQQLKEHPFVLAPSNEQPRIVAEIEKQFTRLDAATAALKRAQANLKRYRASVLKAACEGRLVPTEAELARKEGRDYEPVDKLLQRILRERRARWEADPLAKMQASGKPHKDDHWKQKYKEPSAPDTSNRSELPEGWAWSTIEQLTVANNGMVTGPFGTLIGKSDHRELGIPVVGIPNITKAGFVRGNWFFLDESKASELQRYEINPNDIVVSRSGTVGEACVIGADQGRLIMSTNLMRIRTLPLSGIAEWVVVNLKGSGTVAAQLEDLCKGSTRPFLNLTILSGLLVSLPPEAEQERIFSELSKMLTVIDHLEGIVFQQMDRASHLRQSVLRSAFTGQLVPQDPTDEPASILLERIRTERSTSVTQRPARRSRKEPAHA